MDQGQLTMDLDDIALPGPDCPGSQLTWDWASTGTDPDDVANHVSGCDWCTKRVLAIWRADCPPEDLWATSQVAPPLARHAEECDACSRRRSVDAPAPFHELALAAGVGQRFEARPGDLRVVLHAPMGNDPYRVVIFGSLPPGRHIEVDGHQLDLHADAVGDLHGEVHLPSPPGQARLASG